MYRKKRKFKTLLVITYFGILIPLLGISFWISHYTNAAMEQREETHMQQSVSRTVSKLSNMALNFRSMSTRYALVEELRPVILLSSVQHQRDGIELIKNLVISDSVMSDMVIYYGNGNLYTSDGMVRKQSYFQGALACEEESAARAIALLDQNEDAVTVLRSKNRNSGHLMLLFSNRSYSLYEDEFSITFIISTQKFIEQLTDLIDPSLRYVWVDFPDGTVLCLACENGVLRMLTEKDAPTEDMYIQSEVVTHNVQHMNATLHVYYDREVLFAGVHSEQGVNYALLAAGLLLSTVLAWLIAYHRFRQISLLEVMLQDGRVDHRAVRGELRDLQELMRNHLVMGGAREKSLQETGNMLRYETALLLYHGTVQDNALAMRLLSTCGVTFGTRHYAVGGILFPGTQNAESITQIEQLLAHDLCYRTQLGNRTALFFFTELSAADPAQSMRFALCKNMREVLHGVGITRAMLGVSAEHTELAQIHTAYREAHAVLEHLKQQGTVRDGCLCWEDLHATEPTLQLDEKATAELQAGMQNGDVARAQAALTALLQHIDLSAVDENSRALLRTALLLKIADLVPEAYKNAALAECAKIQIADVALYENSVRSMVLRFAEMHTQRDLFEEICTFLEQHYTESNLSSEQVAEFAGITPQYLSRFFKNRTGLTYIEYLSQLRMRKARDLMCNTDLSVQEIVQRVGYLDASSFRRKFRALYGMSINSYRTLIGKNGIDTK